MSAIFIVDGDNTTIRIEWTAATGRIQALAEDFAEKLFDVGMGDHGTEEEPRVFDDLGNQEKLDMIEAYLLRVSKEGAGAQHIKSGMDTAKDLATSEVEDRYF